MAYLLLIALAYLAAVIDTALGEMLRIGSVAPDLVALLAVVWMLTSRSPWSFLTAGAVALWGDLISPGRVGVGAVWMLLVGFGLSQSTLLPRSRNLAVQLALTACSLIAWFLAVAATETALGNALLPMATQLARALQAALYTTAVALPVFMVAGWMRTGQNGS